MLDGIDEDVCLEESGNKKRRLSIEQVKALEKNFEVENKLEPETKARLAQELGLQPRQVAVWFQNRRGQWKTKQLEKDYSVLKANFDSLKHNYESLQHGRDSLLKEEDQTRGWMSLGGILLCITGSEAIFADLGHFSQLPIKIAFTCVVYPSLILAYMGQAAYLSQHHKIADGQRIGFYVSVPGSYL